jgi:plasmid maintenance system antidote protein VapI
VKNKPAYRSLHEWLDRTGTPQYVLARRAQILESSLSMLLRGSRRCSLRVALRLHEVTGVPVENLVKWPKFQPTARMAKKLADEQANG